MADDIKTSGIKDFGLADDVAIKLIGGGVRTVGELVDKTEAEVKVILGIGEDEAFPETITESLDLFELKLRTVETSAEKRARKRADKAIEDVETERAVEVEKEELGQPLLSKEEIDAIRTRARKRVQAERKEAAEDRLFKDELEKLRSETGPSVVGGTGDDQVRIYVDLAEHSAKIMINGRAFWHGYSYDVPRHVADTLREMMARGVRHQDEIDGKSLTQHYQRSRGALISPRAGIINARTSMA